MSRADELRAELAAVEAEEGAIAELSAAREAYRADPGDSAARERAKAAAEALRAMRFAQRTARGPAEPDPGDAIVTPSPVAGGVGVPKVGG